MVKHDTDGNKDAYEDLGTFHMSRLDVQGLEDRYSRELSEQLGNLRATVVEREAAVEQAKIELSLANLQASQLDKLRTALCEKDVTLARHRTQFVEREAEALQMPQRRAALVDRDAVEQRQSRELGEANEQGAQLLAVRATLVDREAALLERHLHEWSEGDEQISKLRATLTVKDTMEERQRWELQAAELSKLYLREVSDATEQRAKLSNVRVGLAEKEASEERYLRELSDAREQFGELRKQLSEKEATEKRHLRELSDAKEQIAQLRKTRTGLVGKEAAAERLDHLLELSDAKAKEQAALLGKLRAELVSKDAAEQRYRCELPEAAEPAAQLMDLQAALPEKNVTEGCHVRELAIAKEQAARYLRGLSETKEQAALVPRLHTALAERDAIEESQRRDLTEAIVHQAKLRALVGDRDATEQHYRYEQATAQVAKLEELHELLVEKDALVMRQRTELSEAKERHLRELSDAREHLAHLGELQKLLSQKEATEERHLRELSDAKEQIAQLRKTRTDLVEKEAAVERLDYLFETSAAKAKEQAALLGKFQAELVSKDAAEQRYRGELSEAEENAAKLMDLQAALAEKNVTEGGHVRELAIAKEQAARYLRELSEIKEQAALVPRLHSALAERDAIEESQRRHLTEAIVHQTKLRALLGEKDATEQHYRCELVEATAQVAKLDELREMLVEKDALDVRQRHELSEAKEQADLVPELRATLSEKKDMEDRYHDQVSEIREQQAAQAELRQALETVELQVSLARQRSESEEQELRLKTARWREDWEELWAELDQQRRRQENSDMNEKRCAAQSQAATWQAVSQIQDAADAALFEQPPAPFLPGTAQGAPAALLLPQSTSRWAEAQRHKRVKDASIQSSWRARRPLAASNAALQASRSLPLLLAPGAVAGAGGAFPSSSEAEARCQLRWSQDTKDEQDDANWAALLANTMQQDVVNPLFEAISIERAAQLLAEAAAELGLSVAEGDVLLGLVTTLLRSKKAVAQRATQAEEATLTFGEIKRVLRSEAEEEKRCQFDTQRSEKWRAVREDIGRLLVEHERITQLARSEQEAFLIGQAQNRVPTGANVYQDGSRSPLSRKLVSGGDGGHRAGARLRQAAKAGREIAVQDAEEDAARLPPSARSPCSSTFGPEFAARLLDSAAPLAVRYTEDPVCARGLVWGA